MAEAKVVSTVEPKKADSSNSNSPYDFLEQLNRELLDKQSQSSNLAADVQSLTQLIAEVNSDISAVTDALKSYSTNEPTLKTQEKAFSEYSKNKVEMLEATLDKKTINRVRSLITNYTDETAEFQQQLIEENKKQIELQTKLVGLTNKQTEAEKAYNDLLAYETTIGTLFTNLQTIQSTIETEENSQDADKLEKMYYYVLKFNQAFCKHTGICSGLSPALLSIAHLKTNLNKLFVKLVEAQNAVNNTNAELQGVTQRILQLTTLISQREQDQDNEVLYKLQ